MFKPFLQYVVQIKQGQEKKFIIDLQNTIKKPKDLAT
jgi:hypothetical protein